MTTASGAPVHPRCPSCDGRIHLSPAKRAGAADVRAWANALREREGRSRGVTDGLVYETRRGAQSKAAWYRKKLAERGLSTESLTRPRFNYAALSWRWTFVLWRKGSRPGSAVETAWRAHEQSKADRAAESIERGWW